MESPADRLIFALDVKSTDEARGWVERLCGRVGVFKIGLELFISAGPDVVRAVRAAGARAIFLDLKLHDIPETVKGAMGSVASLGVEFVTVHASGGRKMLEAASTAAVHAKVLGVTVLTSLDREALKETGVDPAFTPEALVMHRARAARAGGCAGVVCSGHEAASVRETLGPDLLIVTPGIRSEDDATGDQARVVTPEAAIESGADYIVVGRPIRNAKDPVEAARRVADGIERGLSKRAGR